MTERRYIHQPQPGFYKRRLVKGGPWVAVVIREQAGELVCEVDGAPADVHEIWPLCRPSTQDEADFFARWREWARRHDPSHPAARPTERIDLSALPPRTRR